MITKTTVLGFTHDELVNLFSTATYGSEYLDCSAPKGSYVGTPLESDDDCAEDKWAKVLLAGKSIYVFDFYSEECAYGNLHHEWIEEKQAMRYTLTLDDIKKGVQQILDGDDTYLKDCVNDWIDDDSCNLDLYEAENILQSIVFGEVVYG